MFQISIWGDRGSMPCPGPDTVQFGGNTSCIEVRVGDPEKPRIIVLDAGSGIRQLGDSLMRNDFKRGPLDLDMFLTHTHWDHIMGFPMFTPIYVPGTKLRIYGAVTYEEDTLSDIIGNQLSYKYWPVRQSELSAQISYKHLKETVLDMGEGLVIRTKYLNHPIVCLGYRFEYAGKSFVSVYDHEPYQNIFPTDPSHPDYDSMAAEEGEKVAREENDRIQQFMKGADFLIHDAQYTEKEYKASKLGWGHSSHERAINAAHKAGVKRLALFHHDPNRTDAELTELELRYKNMIEGKTPLQVDMSREGMKVQL
jgi:phosphoribosyl 1,2-cyclic phosphodiesterase